MHCAAIDGNIMAVAELCVSLALFSRDSVGQTKLWSLKVWSNACAPLCAVLSCCQSIACGKSCPTHMKLHS